MEACNHQKQNLVLYAHGELDAAAGKKVESHLAMCEPCRTEWQRLLALLEKLRKSASSLELSSREIKSLVANVKEELNKRQKERWWQRLGEYGPSRMIPVLAMASILIVSLGIFSYVNLSDTSKLPVSSMTQNEELMLSDRDLEIVNNLEFLKELDAIQKLSQVVDFNGESNSQGEMDNDTRGMKQDAYRRYYS